ncbi:hypothetical protein Q3G72_014167 [Acer saccharum]|nr:hypothetical protein Q3G72_014167 [Acer saccharum]
MQKSTSKGSFWRETYNKIQHNRERKGGGVQTTYLFDDGVVEEDVVVGEGVGGADEEFVGDDVAALAVLTLDGTYSRSRQAPQK